MGFALVTVQKEMTVLGEKCILKENDYIELPRFLGNFWCDDISLIEIDNNGNIEFFARLTLKFVNDVKVSEQSKPIIISLKNLEKINWSDIDIRCLIYPEAKNAREHIANMIRISCNKTPAKKMTTIDRLGAHIIEGVHVFNAGDQLHWPDGLEYKPGVKWEPSPDTRLAIDDTLSEEDALVGMMRVTALSPEAGRILTTFNLSCVIREAFIQSGITPRFSVFLHGKTGSKKTTYATFQTQLYNRDVPLKSPPRLNSSIPAAVKVLYEKADCAQVLDDLYPAKDREIHKHQEKTFLEITRIVGDGVEPGRVRGNIVAKAPPRCGILFTGEFYTGSGSDASRLLPVEITVPINDDKLTACQNEPLVLSTFYYYFIRWYITNFHSICERLKEWIAVYRSTKTKVHARLQETQFLMEATYKLFLMYCVEKGFTSQDTAVEQYNSFYHQLRGIIVQQNIRVYQTKPAKANINYLALIRTMFHEGHFTVVRNVKDFEYKYHDGIVHKGYLYLRREGLMKKVHAIEPTAVFEDVVEHLRHYGALRRGENSNSRQLHGCKRRGLRFYCIKLSMLG